LSEYVGIVARKTKYVEIMARQTQTSAHPMKGFADTIVVGHMCYFTQGSFFDLSQ
jgi:hypothetical protein